MQRWIYRFILCIILSANIGSAVPTIPMVISGNISINGEPASPGTDVKALMNGEVLTSYVVDKSGIFGLIVENRPGVRTIDIYVNGIRSSSIDWSSQPTMLNLDVTDKRSQPVEKTSLSQGTSVANTSTASPNAITTVKAEIIQKVEKMVAMPENIEQKSSPKQDAATVPGFEVLNFCIAILFISIIMKRRV
ncbi:MAG: hypothetical protein KKG76_04245 [Euryarchaeota archaeon]|nr:hypothetical protein [Euryarchaeota archaeon]